MPLPPPPPPAPGLSLSALDIIKSALRMCRVLAAGEVPTAADAADSLNYLNGMMDAWNADKMAIPNNQILDFPLVAGKQSYTVGAGGDFSTARPGKIEEASIILLNNPGQPNEQPIEIVNQDQWQDINLKSTPSTFPLVMFDDGSFPFRNLSFWPVPNAINNFRMYSWQPLTQFPDLTTQFSFQFGYLEAIRYNLALRLCDEFGGQLGQTIVAGAQASLAAIRTENLDINLLECDGMYNGTSGGASTSKLRSSLFGIP